MQGSLESSSEQLQESLLAIPESWLGAADALQTQQSIGDWQAYEEMLLSVATVEPEKTVKPKLYSTPVKLKAQSVAEPQWINWKKRRMEINSRVVDLAEEEVQLLADPHAGDMFLERTLEEQCEVACQLQLGRKLCI